MEPSSWPFIAVQAAFTALCAGTALLGLWPHWVEPLLVGWCAFIFGRSWESSRQHHRRMCDLREQIAAVEQQRADGS